jgi:hypothetical protein
LFIADVSQDFTVVPCSINRWAISKLSVLNTT